MTLFHEDAFFVRSKYQGKNLLWYWSGLNWYCTLSDSPSSVASGKTQEEAISKLFKELGETDIESGNEFNPEGENLQGQFKKGSIRYLANN